jgi:enoyl-CoA hydratase/carnithine racemase
MDREGDISIRIVNKVGRITLNRPKALNALTYEMAIAIENALDEWTTGDEVEMIVINAEGDRAFCAGGDIADLYATGKAGDFEFGRKFWADEYRLNAKIANCPIPYVAIMDGITMGGGVGISVHGSDRIVTERSMIAMPECGIGLVPDVGGSLTLSRAPGHLGEYLGMSGYRMGPGDAVLAGFGDVQVASSELARLVARLEETGDLSAISEFAGPADAPDLAPHLEKIDAYFSKASALECVQMLEADGGEWETQTAKLIRRSCPLSVACAFEIIRRARKLDTIEKVLALEYRFTSRSMSDGEFIEGVRAQIIDKDRNPQWATPRLEDVTGEQVDAMLAPLGENELTLTN